ncbi:hydantoinase B/oxoprolinase family protein [Amycolatopsis jejuensis]|uniref:hydantoinase B/oxoprolinase family protein n=1 Tax=Amycolatopsis jejuensis TaxID=330084 RepID=UPI0006913C2B|nr:hydantoinase B/oxoprolinase family protein [Amycolatopsis jejuensis]
MTGTIVLTGVNDIRRPQVAERDPVLTEVIRHALASGAEQMSIAMVRTGVSPGIYEVLDFCCALYDADIRLLGQAQHMPGFLGVLGHCVESSVAAVGGADRLEPGDVLLNTSGYDIGSHPQDAAMIMPAFHDGELVGYAAVKAHQTDLGAKSVFCTDTTDIWQEGVIFPGVKLVRGGVLDDGIHRTLLANSRMPDSLEGDVKAVLYALRAGVGVLGKLIGKYGLDRYRGAVEEMLDHGEALARAALDALPDGSFTASGQIDNDGIGADPVPITVIVEKAGRDVVVDLSKAADQTTGPTNCPLSSSLAAARVALLPLLVPGELINEGHLRPIRVRTRVGSQFHPVSPAPVYIQVAMGVATDLAQKAFAGFAPDDARAGCGGDICGVALHGVGEDGRYWFSGHSHLTGQGAMAHADGGAPLMWMTMSGQKSMPAEATELRTPNIVRRWALAEDSAGAGTHRGGLGLQVTYEIRRNALMMGLAERSTSPGWGMAGGGDGQPNRMLVHYPDGRTEQIYKKTDLPLPPGTLVDIRAGGGGGWGPPGDRPAEAVHRDVEEGYLSEEQARRDYPHAFRAPDADA